MTNETSIETLQHILHYYRSKCSQLEYDFLVYKLQAENKLTELQEQISQLQEKTN